MIDPQNLAEAEVEGKTTALLSNVDDLKVLVLHSVSELHFRETAIECLGDVVSLDAGTDYNLLVEVTNRC